MVWLELTAGLLLLLGGGEALVKGAVEAAQRLNVSPLLIGLTLVGFGTSTPELVASLEAAFIGAPGIAVGNIVGSNIANILLILGVSAVILPLSITPAAFHRDGTVLVGASLLLVAVSILGTLSNLIGIVFLGLLAAYTVWTFLAERRREDASARMHLAEGEVLAPRKPGGMALPFALLVAFGGIAAVVVGANLLVGSAVVLSRELGVSESVIGLTLVAVGTSLPELAVSVLAAIRRQGDVALGNIVGSNIFNILGIAGVTATVAPVPVPPEIKAFDIWVMLATALLLVCFAVTGWRISRLEGATFLAGYGIYLWILI
ncbi:calcium/sodium antiporter [Limibacillus sp. MBR-115]|uniref:calcium/sodium antiporter n=1 Tax=Limibacillus sp. MBR-115 TaxID=3156465 RepID=UPI003393EBCA